MVKSVETILENWDRIISQVPYRRDDEKESARVIHIPVPHPDRNPNDPKTRHLLCDPITWADMCSVMEVVRANIFAKESIRV